MEFSSFELKDKDSKGDNLIETAEYFDESEMKKRKFIRIVIIVSILLIAAIVAIILAIYLHHLRLLILDLYLFSILFLHIKKSIQYHHA